jgi:hypothetical protein
MMPTAANTAKEITASALYLASKIEDTAKRPNQVFAACYNLNLPLAEQRQPDDDVGIECSIATLTNSQVL